MKSINELLPIETNSERITVSARDLHKFLEATERFSAWFERNTQYGLEENIDYVGCKQFNALARKELQDYQLTIDAGKEISMLQRNEKGRQARKYFIGIEKAWNSPEKIMARALQISNQEIESLRIINTELKPKALFADSVAASHTSILIGDLAKLLKQNGYDTGQNKLFKQLRNEGFLIKRKGVSYNMPTQRSMDLELFEVKESTYNNPNGSVGITKTTKVTGKGQIYFINRFLGDGKITKER